MRLEQLQAFLAVADTGSFQKAAKQCGVTQSTISRQIQALEAEVSLPLFHRSAQAKLTIAGDRLLNRARRICHEWKAAVTDLSDLLEGKQSELCIAVIHSVCAYYLPPVLQTFCDDYPNVQLRVTSLGSDRALKVLRDGLVDLAIVMNNKLLTMSSEMVVDSLYSERIDLLMAADHPLSAYDSVPWEAIAQYPQVIFKDGYGMSRLLQEQFTNQGLDLNVSLELNTLDAFRGIVRQGNFVALLPQSALADIGNDPTLVVRSTSPLQLTRDVVLVTTEDRLAIPPIQRFRTLVCERLGAISPGPFTLTTATVPQYAKKLEKPLEPSLNPE
ncbi:MAG: LysR family transcriptional regulator [Merismopedia sp. SIO2A8]|nr:LysR family transcriptional regulator [Symploca sp. SIO2B6]NET47546.1 LysR family transcriptional regulator [Merismopedia sp. SIO2A8]